MVRPDSSKDYMMALELLVITGRVIPQHLWGSSRLQKWCPNLFITLGKGCQHCRKAMSKMLVTEATGIVFRVFCSLGKNYLKPVKMLEDSTAILHNTVKLHFQMSLESGKSCGCL